MPALARTNPVFPSGCVGSTKAVESGLHGRAGRVAAVGVVAPGARELGVVPDGQADLARAGEQGLVDLGQAHVDRRGDRAGQGGIADAGVRRLGLLRLLSLQRRHGRARRPRHAVQEILSGLTGDHPRRHGVGVPLVAVAGLPHAVGEVDARLLLHDVRGLVRGGEEARLAVEGHVPAHRVGRGAQGPRRVRRRAAGVRPHGRDVVATEQVLDPLAVRQRRSLAAESRGRRVAGGRRRRVEVGP
jgi:hypothetical protein